MRQALRSVIEDERDMLVIGEAGNGREAVTLARAGQPDLVIMDLFMPVMDGVQAIAELVKSQPAGRKEIRILALTSSTEDTPLLAAAQAGAAGVILKDSQPGEILQALRLVAQGGEYWPPQVAARLARGLRRPAAEPALTAREQDVLGLLGQGASNAQIARRLQISEATARAHVYHILQKLGLENRTQAALYAQERLRKHN
jgi:DNA-binding NarL/FixJ family response regulator